MRCSSNTVYVLSLFTSVYVKIILYLNKLLLNHCYYIRILKAIIHLHLFLLPQNVLL